MVILQMQVEEGRDNGVEEMIPVEIMLDILT
jgi:hypothetical protein